MPLITGILQPAARPGETLAFNREERLSLVKATRHIVLCVVNEKTGKDMGSVDSLWVDLHGHLRVLATLDEGQEHVIASMKSGTIYRFALVTACTRTASGDTYNKRIDCIQLTTGPVNDGDLTRAWPLA